MIRATILPQVEDVLFNYWVDLEQFVSVGIVADDQSQIFCYRIVNLLKCLQFDIDHLALPPSLRNQLLFFASKLYDCLAQQPPKLVQLMVDISQVFGLFGLLLRELLEQCWVFTRFLALSRLGLRGGQ